MVEITTGIQELYRLQLAKKIFEENNINSIGQLDALILAKQNKVKP